MTEITHLVVNGCSWTYCEGLEDPATQGWPALLAKKLDVKVVNLAVRGCGNGSIHRRTYEYVYENLPTNSKPFFVIAWSQYWRKEYWSAKHDDYRHVSFPHDTPKNNTERALLENWNYLDFYRKTYLYKLSLMNLFKTHDIPYIMSDFASPPPEDIPTVKQIRDRFPNLVNTCTTDYNEIDPLHTLTQGFKPLPCGHDDIEAQIVLADYTYNEIIRRHNIQKVTKENYLTLDNFRLSENPHEFYNQTVWR